jgi:universal stress protein A
MFETIAVNADHIIGIRASGRLTDKDYKEFLPELEKLINREGPLSLYVDMENFEGWEPKAAWDDLKFGLAHDVDFKRIAVIGDKKWMEWMIRLSDIFFSAEIRYFPAMEKQQAMDWLQKVKEVQTEKKTAVNEPVLSYKHILLATDFSPHARYAGRRAKEMAEKYQARLSLVHVFDDFIFYDDFYEPVAAERFELQKTLQDSAQKQLTSLAEELNISNAGSVHLLTGSPKPTILSFAGEHDIDLIVVGSHGRRGIERLLGSVAAGIINGAPCDVLTVRL